MASSTAEWMDELRKHFGINIDRPETDDVRQRMVAQPGRHLKKRDKDLSPQRSKAFVPPNLA
jgi:hypothetical protein